MADLDLRTDYKDDILDSSVNEKRTYNLVDQDGNIVAENVSLEDTSAYTQHGDSFGAVDINRTNEAVMELNQSLRDGLSVALTYKPDTDYFGFEYDGEWHDVVYGGVQSYDILKQPVSKWANHDTTVSKSNDILTISTTTYGNSPDSGDNHYSSIYVDKMIADGYKLHLKGTTNYIGGNQMIIYLSEDGTSNKVYLLVNESTTFDTIVDLSAYAGKKIYLKVWFRAASHNCTASFEKFYISK